MNNLLVIMMSATMLVSCDKISARPTNLPARVEKDVAYGNHPMQTLDVYLPANRNEETKLLVLIHGGGWSNGDKRDFNPYVEELKKRFPQFAFATLNYRLITYTDNKFPAQEQDVKAAIEFLLARSKEFQISNDIILLGASAGGHLALLQGYKYPSIGNVKAVISLFGPTDITDMYKSPSISNLPYLMKIATGYTLQENPTIYEQSSPVNFVNKSTAPTLLLHGENDYLVPVRQARLLAEKLKQYNVKHKIITYPAEGHGWRGARLTDSFDKIEAFIEEHVL